MEETSRGRNQILLLIGLVLTVGTVGYYLIEDGWSLMDAFYMTVITITTIGYGEIHPLSREGRFFTVFLIVFGLGTTALFATHFARLILENALKGNLGKRKMEKMISKLANHFIVCGFGRIGRAICAELQEKNIPFVVVESSEEAVELARHRLYHVIHGNATTDLVLLSAGIRKARGLVSALSSDADNLYLSLTARELNAKLYIVVRGEGEGVESRMHRAGADIVVSPFKLGGKQIAQIAAEQSGEALAERGTETLSSVLGFHLKVYKNMTGGQVLVGDALKETGAFSVLARQKAGGEVVYDPLPDEALAPDEGLVLVLHEGRTAERAEEPLPEEEMDWDSGLSVGVMSIDEEHQIILGLIHKMKIASRKNERQVISAILNELIDYTVRHFQHEEALLGKHGYPDLAQHMAEHEELKRKVKAMLQEKDYLVKENFSSLLNQWLRHHIMGTDKKYSEFLVSRGAR